MRYFIRLVLLGVLAAVSLAACSSSGGDDSGSVTSVPIATVTTDVEDTSLAEAADLPTRRPQFLNSFADW